MKGTKRVRWLESGAWFHLHQELFVLSNRSDELWLVQSDRLVQSDSQAESFVRSVVSWRELQMRPSPGIHPPSPPYISAPRRRTEDAQQPRPGHPVGCPGSGSAFRGLRAGIFRTDARGGGGDLPNSVLLSESRDHTTSKVWTFWISVFSQTITKKKTAAVPPFRQTSSPAHVSGLSAPAAAGTAGTLDTAGESGASCPGHRGAAPDPGQEGRMPGGWGAGSTGPGGSSGPPNPQPAEPWEPLT